MVCSRRRKTSSQSRNQSQHLEVEQSKSDYDQLSVYDEIIDLDQHTNEACDDTYDVPDDELTNETYDHTHAVYGRSTPTPYEDLNARYDHPDAVPERSAPNAYQDLNAAISANAVSGRSTPEPYQDLNEATTKPTTTPVYLELIGEDEEKNEKSEC